ncbi:MATE family efflux transporter [Parablautia muri]|uniref:MATE family efflux transporter n=1 Tax=Parablautia muri TaxID=2320879 RepID=A0A9X5BDK0_9FIRM|nr:MATE family efflux transporter [Parablautia muri]NBJ92044.1 MATE family efflux transporter [Parablautia muri]
MKTNRYKLSNQITEGVIWKQLLFFFFPILFGTFFQQLYNTTDAVIVGKFVGKEALAAVGGPAATLINLLIGFFTGLSSGATVIISQYYGAKKEDDVRKTVHTAMALSVAGGAVIMVLGLLFSGAALRAMNTPEDILKMSVVYMRVYFLGVIPALIYNMGSGILRAVGDSKRPLYFLILSCITNIILDFLFVTGLKMGVAGVAVATSLSQVISALMVCIALMKAEDSYRLYIKEIRFHPMLLHSIVRIGLPAGIQSTMYSLSNLIIQSSINSFGTDTIAAWTAYGKIDGIFWMIMGAYGVSITTFAGQNFGAGKYDRIRKSVRICLGMAAFTSFLLSFVVLAGGHVFFRMFTDDANVVSIGLGMMRVISPSYVTFICIEILGGTTRGCGDAVLPTVMTGIGVCALRVIWTWVVVPLRPEVSTVAFSYPLTWVVTSIFFIIYYLRGNWLKRCRRMGYSSNRN